ncbi:MAG: hypothetical protein KDH89_03555 [Anaerolineae bacterium]|nr:hypothetical protein [Anaerolineae bacterium]
MPTPRGAAASAVLNNKIYVMGGWTTQDSAVVEVYDPAADTWSTKTPMPTPRNNLAAAVLNGKIYAIGGWSGAANTNVVEVYDPTTNTWSSAAPLPAATLGLRATVVNGKIYAVGGWRPSGVTGDVVMYDPATNSWTSRSPMPTAREELAVVVVAGKIFALGGSSDSGALDTVEIYDPVANSWSAGVSLPVARQALAAANIDGKIYAVGGGDSNHLRFDPTPGAWQTLTPVPTSRWSPVAEAVAGKLYVIGGWADTGSPNANEAYTPPVAATPVVSVAAGFGASDIQSTLNAFVNQSHVIAAYRQHDDLWTFLLDCQALNNCPEIAIVPNPGLIKELAERGALREIDSVIPTFDTYYAAPWRRLGSVEGVLYGLPVNASSKSMVWYRPQSLTGVGATPPSDWGGLLNLADNFVAHGQTPFAIGAESGTASGWPLTDIFENILVHTAGPEVQRRLVNHTIAWTDPTIVTAMQRFTDIIGDDDYVAGGAAGILTTSFWDAIDMALGDPPSAGMYFGASWVQGLIDPALTPIDDYNYFQFPVINPAVGNPMTGGGDLATLMEDSSPAKALMQFLATPATGEVWVASSEGHISPNNGVSLDSYTNPIARAVAQQISTTSDFLFDLDDQLPSGLQTYFWEQLMYFVAHQDQISVVLQRMEERATELQGSPYPIFLPAVARSS